jgi:cobalamin biosynthesis protein CobD/CbiB
MKNPFGCRWNGAAGAILCAAAIIAGCASVAPPTEQMAVSKAAIANAVSAGGSEYASVEMRSAQEKMDRASRAMGKEDYEDARRLAEQAQADARLAEKKAQSAKAEKAASVTHDDIRVLREEMNRKTQ